MGAPRKPLEYICLVDTEAVVDCVPISSEPIEMCGKKTEAVAADAKVKRVRVCGEAC